MKKTQHADFSSSYFSNSIALLGIVFGLSCSSLFAQPAQPNTWVTNGRVKDITLGSGRTFLAGDFNWVGENYRSGGVVFNADLSDDAGWPKPDGEVSYAVSDDAGGYYVAAYDFVDHIKADHTIEKLSIDVQGIYALAKNGNLLYIGGAFTQVNSTARNYLASFDLTNNTLTSWNPNPNDYIYSLNASGNLVYAGGSFSSIGGATRSRIAALDATNGTATTWDAKVSTASYGYVNSIQLSTTTVFFGGSFINVANAASPRKNIAAVNISSGALLTFNPLVNGYVRVLKLDGSTLYISGDISSFNGKNQNTLAAYSTTTGLILSFDAQFESIYEDVYALAVDGQNLIVGGDFINIAGQSKPRLAVLDKTTAALVATAERNIAGSVSALVPGNGKLFVGGSIQGVKGIIRSAGFTALDQVTGIGVNWNPGISIPASVDIYQTQIKYYKNRVYYYLRFSDDTHQFGALDALTGDYIKTFNVNVTGGGVSAWAFGDDQIFIAGDFTTVNGSDREGFAALDWDKGTLLPWTITFHPNYPKGDVISSLVYYKKSLFVSGVFSYTEGNNYRNHLAAWSAVSGDLLPWAPDVSLEDYATPILSSPDNDKIYIIGDIGLRVDTDLGEADGWSYATNGGIYSMAVAGSSVFLAGGFSPGLVRVDISTAIETGEQPSLEDVTNYEDEVAVIATNGTKLFVGGDFVAYIDDDARNNYAEYLIKSSGNQPPVIEQTNVKVTSGTVIVFPVSQYISDPDGNLDLSTLQVVEQPSSGALASIDAEYNLIVDYSGITVVSDESLFIEVCDLSGACSQQEVFLDTGGELNVYNGISPNGDNKNDSFFIENIDIYPASQNKVSIFNRWGDLVFEALNYDNISNPFVGRSKSGHELPAGIYFYKIAFSNGDKTLNGFITLKR